MADDIERVKAWASLRKLSEETAATLINLGFTSMEAISCLEADDLSKAKLPIGQQKLLLKAVKATFPTGDAVQATEQPMADRLMQQQREANASAGSDEDSNNSNMAAPVPNAEASDEDFVREVLAQLRRCQTGQQSTETATSSQAIEAQQVPKRHGSAEDLLKGSNFGEPDSFWDIDIYGNETSRGLEQRRSSDAHEELERMSRRSAHRRHTVGGNTLLKEQGDTAEDGIQKREAFMDLLAKRYPKFADKISGSSSEDGYPIQARRPRDPQRRATVVTYNPHHDRAVEFDDRSETMSNVEGPVASFQRGSWLRNSMPIVRTPPNTYDTRRGLVFLVVGDETKKAELPNEITHLDTVRALFVRSFLGRLTMEYLESPKRKIYILDPVTSIYYQLEDLRDIKDRSVLRLYECDSKDPQKVKDPPPEVRGKVIQTPRDATPPRGANYPVDTPATAVTDQVRKSQTLPPSMSHSYPPPYEGEYDVPRPKSAERSRSLPRGHVGPDYAYVTYHSPERSQFPQDARLQSTPPDRPNLRTIPENLQIQNGYPGGHVIYEDLDSRYHYPVHPGAYNNRAMSPPVQRTEQPVRDPLRRAMSPPPSGAISQTYDTFRAPGGPAPGAPPQTYVAKGVRASTVVSPLRATGPNKDSRVPNNRHSLAFTPVADVSPSKGTARSQSYRVSSETEQAAPVHHRQRSVTPQPTPSDCDTRFRMDKMEEQIASLAAWVQTAVSNSSSRASSVRSNTSNGNTPSEGPNTGSIASKEEKAMVVSEKGISDISSASSQHTITQNIKDCILTIRRQTSDLKMDLRNMRRMNQLNNESVQEAIHETMKKIAKALKIVPGAEQQLLRQQRTDVNVQWQKYLEHRSKVYKELGDLEAAVEELRADVLSRQCRVNMTDVEAMALMLSNITKSFGDLKVKFPELQKELKVVMAGEMEVVVKEERFLTEEPDAIEEALKRCKKLTGTLFTLKRLASVQEQRPLQVPPPSSVGGKIPSVEDKKVLLENIKAMVPDHEARVQSLEAADASRERKRKIVTQQEALKFGKSLEIATKLLKSNTKDLSGKPASQGKSSDSVDGASKDIIIQTTSVISTATKTTSSVYSDAKISSDKISDPPKQNNPSRPSELAKDVEEDTKRKVAILAVKKDAARAAFFSSLTTPPTSPAEEKRFSSPPRTTTMDYTVRISPVRVTSSGEIRYTVTNSSTTVPSHTTHTSAYSSTKPTFLPLSTKRTSGYKSASPSPSPPTPSYSISSDQIRKSSPSSIPRFSMPKRDTSSETSDKVVKKAVLSGASRTSSDRTTDVDQDKTVPKTSMSKTDSSKFNDKKPGVQKVIQAGSSMAGGRPKKVPPPPPPRKSSKLPGHVGPIATEVSFNGSATMVTPARISTQQEGIKGPDSSIVLGHQTGPQVSGVVCTSTPKSAIPPKPSSKFEKGIVEKMVAGAQISTQCSEEKEKVPSKPTDSEQPKVNGGVSHDPAREEREGSSDSTASSSSLDSQQGGVVLRSKVPPAKKQKPPPPQRKSSLSQSSKDASSDIQKVNGNEGKGANVN